MAGGQRTLTIKFIGDSKSMTRSVKDIVSNLDDAESSGKKVATAMRQLSGEAESNFRDARDAADKLANALGPEMVSQIEAAGRSVDGYVADLQRMGLSFDDVRTDVDELAAAIRDVETTKANIDGLQAPLKKVDDGLRDVVDSGDQSRSVLANMVGNSAQDLGALGGVAGTAGMAIGQLAEYATEGNINMSGLAKVAGPMAGVSAAVIGVTWAMGKLREGSEKAKEEAAAMLEVHKAIRDGKFEEAGAKLAEEYGTLASTLESLGVPQQEVMDFILGVTDQMPTFNRLLEENKIQFAEGGTGLTDFGGKLNDLGGDVYDARDAFAEQEDQLVATEQATVQFTDALMGAARETGNTEIATRDLEEAYKQLTGQLSDEEAWYSLQESLRQFREDMDDSTLSANEKRLKMVQLKQELIEYASEVGNIPAEKQTEILALIEEGNLAAAEQALANLTRPRNVPISAVTGGALITAPRKADGGPVSAGMPYIVGDNPDGSLNRTSELFVPSTNGTILSAADTRALLGGGGGGTTVIHVSVQVAPTADKAAIGREIQEVLRAADRAYGAVYAPVRS